MPASAVPRATRRAAVLGALAGALLTGCDLDLPGSASDVTASPAPSPDLELADAALAATDQALALVTAVRTAHPGLRRGLDPLVALHRAHGQVLTDTGAGAPPSSPVPVPRSPGEALRQVRAREQGLQLDLAGWSVAARDGALARLLAVLSAGVAQQLADPDGALR